MQKHDPDNLQSCVRIKISRVDKFQYIHIFFPLFLLVFMVVCNARILKKMNFFYHTIFILRGISLALPQYIHSSEQKKKWKTREMNEYEKTRVMKISILGFFFFFSDDDDRKKRKNSHYFLYLYIRHILIQIHTYMHAQTKQQTTNKKFSSCMLSTLLLERNMYEN